MKVARSFLTNVTRPTFGVRPDSLYVHIGRIGEELVSGCEPSDGGSTFTATTNGP